VDLLWQPASLIRCYWIGEGVA